MKPNIAAIAEAAGNLFASNLTVLNNVGSSLRLLQFNDFAIDAKYDLPVAVGDFRLARFDFSGIGLTIQHASTEGVDPPLPDRGALIDLALVVHMDGTSMSGSSIAVWFGELTAEPYLEAYLDYEDGTHEQLNLLGSIPLEPMSAFTFELSDSPLTAVWLLASSEILLLNLRCSVRADA